MEERFDRLDRFRDQRDRRLDQFLETGRQLVDGVSGRRPGQRPGQRRSGLDLDSVGRWVGEKVEWLLEEDDDWQEPWQESGRGRPGGARPGSNTSTVGTRFGGFGQKMDPFIYLGWFSSIRY